MQDYTESTSDEIEVKFQLTRETLEAMLRSMTYISEQLSGMVRRLFSNLFLRRTNIRRTKDTSFGILLEVMLFKRSGKDKICICLRIPKG